MTWNPTGGRGESNPSGLRPPPSSLAALPVTHFGGYHLCKTLDEARQVASNMKPDTGMVYSNGFYSENLQRHVGKGKWFPID